MVATEWTELRGKLHLPLLRGITNRCFWKWIIVYYLLLFIILYDVFWPWLCIIINVFEAVFFFFTNKPKRFQQTCKTDKDTFNLKVKNIYMFILFVSIFSAALINKPNQGDAHRLYTKDGNEGLKIKPTQTCLEPVFFFCMGSRGRLLW